MGIDGFDCEVIDGKIARVTAFLTEKEALEAAGGVGVALWTKSSSSALHGKQHSLAGYCVSDVPG